MADETGNAAITIRASEQGARIFELIADEFHLMAPQDDQAPTNAEGVQIAADTLLTAAIIMVAAGVDAETFDRLAKAAHEVAADMHQGQAEDNAVVTHSGQEGSA